MGPECLPGRGRTVTQLPDVLVPEVVVPAAASRTSGAVLPGFTIPAQLVDAGCVIRHEAPGGCLGAVEITGTTIPAVTIPRSVLPAAALGGRRLPELVFDAVTAAGTQAPPVRAQQVCRVATGDRIPSVTRIGIVRKALSRNGIARPGRTREDLTVQTVRVPAVRLPDVDVDPERLSVVRLRGQLTRIGDDDRVSLVTPADVLFDLDSAALRADASQSLADLSRELTSPVRRLLVEGHTDSTGSDSHNLTLSAKRAQEVADWLVTHAGVTRTSLTVVGLGEQAPAFTNQTAAGRQGNRRVVITVVP